MLSKKILIALSLFSLSLMFIPSSYAASFDCKLARTTMEKMICTNPALNKMDEVLGLLYFKAVKIPSNQGLRSEQRKWLKERNSHCENLQSCESFFIKRIETLAAASHVAMHDLTIGMALPSTEQLDNTSKKALKLNDKDKNYTPWLRKMLIEHLSLDSSFFSTLDVAVSKGEIYVYFIKKVNDELFLYEYSLLSKQLYKVARVDQKTRRTELVVGDQVHYFATDDRNGISKVVYDIGSQTRATEIEYFPNYDDVPHNTHYGDRDLSNDKSKLVFETYGNLYLLGEEDQYSKLYEYTLRINEMSKTSQFNKTSSVAIYDSTTDKVNVILDNIENDQWAIYNLMWAADDSAIYFDNHGVMACIWEYRIQEDKLYKIVPEHEARMAQPFTFEGRDYIVYIDEDKLMLAARPK